MKDLGKGIHWEKGRVYFTRVMERKIFFFLTVIMLAAGVAFKAGLF